MLRCLIILLLVASSLSAHAQLMQRVKGQVSDRDSHSPLPDVTVAITDLQVPATTTTDSNGRFVLDSIPVGKHNLSFLLGSYQPQTMADVLVTSGREVILEVVMQESAARKLDEQVVRTKR